MPKKIDNTVVLNMEPTKTNNTIIETKKTSSPANTIKLQIEPSKPLKYHETDKFKKEMEAYEYKIKDDEVVLLKIKNPSEKMIIPDSVNIIEDEAFGYYLSGFKTKVKEVYIPNSVIKIGKGLFKNNAYIEYLQLSEIKYMNLRIKQASCIKRPLKR